MNKKTRIGIYVVLLLTAVVFGQRFFSSYQQLMNTKADSTSLNLEDVRLPDYSKRSAPKEGNSHLAVYAALLFAVVVALGLLASHDFSRFCAHRTLKVLYNDEGEGLANPQYDQAEQEWADGNHLEAIRLMREYLGNNPREQHVALRIAEIYEKDLHNYLAAALEYEEVLKQKLSPERWGWAAIHLCNLYSSKLNQPDKAIVLLRRIDAEVGETPAAEKARKRLAEVDGSPSEATQEIVVPEAATQTAPKPAAKLPRGFQPKKA